MEFRETIQADLDYLADHSVSRGVQKQQPEQIDYMFTLEHEGVILAVGGFRLINLTTAWCWLDLSDESGKHIRPVYRVVKEWIDKFVETHKIKRLQAYIEPNFPQAIRTAEHLGFKWESTMPNFIDNQPALMYVRLI